MQQEPLEIMLFVIPFALSVSITIAIMLWVMDRKGLRAKILRYQRKKKGKLKLILICFFFCLLLSVTLSTGLFHLTGHPASRGIGLGFALGLSFPLMPLNSKSKR